MIYPVFTGVCTALVTPFLDNKINYPMLEQLLRRQIDAGVTCVVLSGTTGEAPTLSKHEKTSLIKCAKAYVGDACTVIAGTGTNSTQHALAMSIEAQESGADALLIVSPYYNKGNMNGLYAHYSSIAQSVSIPIILYNVPSRTGLDMPISLYKELSQFPNIVGVKEASSDITKVTRTLYHCGNKFNIWTGNDDLIVPSISLGAKGVISVLANVCPEETVAMVNAALSGDFKTAAAVQCRMQPMIDALFAEVNPVPVKYAMKCAGYDCGECRPPLGMLSDENCTKIKYYFS